MRHCERERGKLGWTIESKAAPRLPRGSAVRDDGRGTYVLSNDEQRLFRVSWLAEPVPTLAT
jgi:hypothetical protein